MKLTEEGVRACLPAWHGSFVRWATRWALRGPCWVPFEVRKVPLLIGCELARLRVQVRYPKGGMGAVAPMKRSAADVEMLADKRAARGSNHPRSDASPARPDKHSSPHK